MFQTKVVEKIKTRILLLITFFANRLVYEVYVCMCGFKTSGDAFRLPHSIAFCCSIHPFHIPSPSAVPFTHSTFHCLLLFHSPIPRSLSPIAIYIPSFQILRRRPGFFLPSRFQLIVTFGNRVRSILSTCPYQMSCFRVISSSTVSGASIISLIYMYVVTRVNSCNSECQQILCKN